MGDVLGTENVMEFSHFIAGFPARRMILKRCIYWEKLMRKMTARSRVFRTLQSLCGATRTAQLTNLSLTLINIMSGTRYRRNLTKGSLDGHVYE